MAKAKDAFSDDKTGGSGFEGDERVQHIESALIERVRQIVPDVSHAKREDWYAAVAGLVRDELIPAWQATEQTYASSQVEGQAHYLSIEWLLGPNISTALQAAKLEKDVKQALTNLGHDPQKILDFEMDPGLGNGGLGRLAACFIDSGANLHIPLHGYGLFYRDGFFRQVINEEGQQVERPHQWHSEGYPWTFRRGDVGPFSVTLFKDNPKVFEVRAHDMMAPSYDGRTVNTLRLWELVVPEDFDAGDAHKNWEIRAVNKQLYPSDHDTGGKDLRLLQEYVLVSASLQSILNDHLSKYDTLDNLYPMTSIQINDTHPALAIPELMRLLVDEHGMEWERAKEITCKVCNYTNHTLMPEALEKWDRGKLDYLSPRIESILYRLHNELMEEADVKFAHLSDEDRAQAKARIAVRYGDDYRMGHLAAFHSGRVNGVSAMHTELVFEDLFPDLIAMRGSSIKVNHTNGISQRRFLVKANPALATLITRTMGDEVWITDLEHIRVLEDHMEDPDFMERFAAIKRGNKERLADLVREETGVELDTDALFDVQVKRIHEYKRQLMNLLHTVALYQDMKEHPEAKRPKIAKIMAGKAAPGYGTAKGIIALAHKLQRILDEDQSLGGKLKLAFIPDYNVRKAEIIVPGANLSEQISTAGTEASGTSNMKFALNGAITIGTRDGANVEIGEETGEENIFFFGKTEEELEAINAAGYKPAEWIEKSPRLKKALEFLDSIGFKYLADTVRNDDRYRIAADFDDYWDKHHQAADLYHNNRPEWRRRAVINTIAGAHFSSDRTVEGYARQNWAVHPVYPDLDLYDEIRALFENHSLDVPLGLRRNGSADTDPQGFDAAMG
ncbi:MAG: glycogen/starch/alpha-glucan family phosphorylase [Rhodospirillales bacterium]|nr:glycogen/starch/alpha-glucan family phosphorylase [Alphaproteobacteria bacterium]MCB1838763.1 glycogen/starch/alpha-glucan family phosphorylase [Alphaproteobacteria bacterium]MCB9977295.1 glycogen/starch/alpha-glucan family phosphorylase [Rhodospirillales bacterium]